FVGIIGFRHGAIADGRADQSYSELEFDTATRLHIPRLVFLIHDDARHIVGTDDPLGLQRAFRHRLQASGVTTVWVRSPADLELALLHALVEWVASDRDRRGAGSRELQSGIVVPASAHFAKEEELERRRFLQWMAGAAASSAVDNADRSRQYLEVLRRSL